MREVRPDLCRDFNPWDEVTTAEALTSLLEATGAADIDVTLEPGTLRLSDPADW